MIVADSKIKCNITTQKKYLILNHQLNCQIFVQPTLADRVDIYCFAWSTAACSSYEMSGYTLPTQL